jgi:hypothetical protein
MKLYRKPPGTKGLTWSVGAQSDGYKIRGSKEGGWCFVEGKSLNRIEAAELSREDDKKINAAAKKWGVHGIGVCNRYTEVGGLRFY